MKQELPFAVVLLAVGGLLWFWQSDKEKTPIFDIQHSDSPQLMADDAGISSNPYPVAQAGFQASIEEESFPKQTEPLNSENSLATLPQNEFGKIGPFIHERTDQQSVQLMSDIAQKLAFSQPFSSSLQLTGNIFGKQVSANGTYSQMGQGTHKSRIELKFGSEPNSPSVFQLCDGRFVYNLQTSQMPLNINGKKQTFEFVDLNRIKKSSGEQRSGFTPTGWVATGGISSLFQHLASAFNFGSAEQTDESTIILRGSWDRNSLNMMSSQSVEATTKSNKMIRWEKVSRQLPHAVELTLKSNDAFYYFPTQITYLVFEHQGGGQYEARPVMNLFINAPEPLVNLTDRFFVIDSSNLDSVDATDRYVARIDAFKETRQAAEQANTLDR